MSKRGSGPLVLYVDDDENSHVLLRHAFAKAGLTATLFPLHDGTEAIHYLAGEREFADRTKYPLPDVLLLDLKMPKVSGLGVLDYLSNKPALRHIPAIIFSCSDAHQDVTRAYELRCFAYVSKPSSMDKLIQFARALQRELLEGKGPQGNPVTAEFLRCIIPPPDTASALPELVDAPAKAPAESNDVFRLLVEQIKDYGISMLDREGRVLSWNDGARRITGYDTAEMIGRHISALYLPQDRDNEKPAFELRMTTDMGRYEDDGWRLRRDGSRFWANVVITPLRDSTGAVSGFAYVARDLTQKKIQEDSTQRLLDSEERFRLLVDQVKDYAIFILDAKGNIASWNQGARRLKGYSADEVMGKHFSIFYTPEDIQRDHPAKELSIAIREARYEEEGWRVRKDGSRMWANVVITSLWDKRGNLTGFAKVTRDLTVRKQQEEALKRKTEELEAFAHTISHDLRSPLRTVSNFAQILRSEAKGLSDYDKTCVDKIIQSAERMETLISDILNLSQVGISPFTEETLLLDDVVEECIRMLEADILRTRAKIRVSKPLPMVNANRTLLIQVFSNLIGNAIKFSRRDEIPNVQIWAVTSDGQCEIHVRDEGVGIPERYHASVFNAFERGAADAAIGGSGIGLAVVKKAVLRLGGTVSLQSREGQGAEFVITLPGCREVSVTDGLGV